MWELEHAGSLAAGADFLDRLVSHYVLDDGRLLVAHAGLTQTLQGRSSGAVRDFCLYGDVTGETDEEGYPVRRDWAVNYRGPAKVVYGHIVNPRPEWVNNTINIDTGCVFGSRLTALRYPELELGFGAGAAGLRRGASQLRAGARIVLPAADRRRVGFSALHR